MTDNQEQAKKLDDTIKLAKKIGKLYVSSDVYWNSTLTTALKCFGIEQIVEHEYLEPGTLLAIDEDQLGKDILNACGFGEPKWPG